MEQQILNVLALERPGLLAAIREMHAFEQAVDHGVFYTYPLAAEDSVVARRYRLLLKLADGRVRLNRRGRLLAELH